MSDLTAEVRAALAAATPGPWRSVVKAPCITGVAGTQAGSDWGVCWTGDEMTRYSSEDAHLIASAPSWLAALCDRLDAEPAPVKPSREDVARVICSYSGPLGTHYMDVALAVADAVLALLPGRTVEETYHDEYTLVKVYWSLGRCGLGDVQITDAVNEMQNAGILFRERGEPVPYPCPTIQALNGDPDE